MKIVDYDQVARFEAASELLTVFIGICRNLKDKFPENAEALENKRYETRVLKQKLTMENNEMVKDVIDTYGPITREYYKNPKDFKLTKSFLR